MAYEKDFIGAKGLPAWLGVVEDRQDPLMLGRAKIRIHGWHTKDKQEMPTESLPWSVPIIPLDSGRNPIGVKEADWVFGYFLDGDEAQFPIFIGIYPGIPELPNDPTMGFNDPRTEAQLEKAPFSPTYRPLPVEEDTEGEEVEATGKFDNEDVLPGNNTAFGELVKDYDPSHYKFDVNNDGVYNSEDASLLIDPDQDGESGIFDGEADLSLTQEVLPITGYPLEDELKEPITSRLARNENINKTIVARKRGELTAGETASHVNSGIGTDSENETEGFGEPETPYAAVYPYNHVHESESGHVIEIDDTPGAERLHHYHRSGSFCEYHPAGTIVQKAIADMYNLANGDNNNFAGGDYNISATGKLTAIGESVNLQSRGAMNIDSGAMNITSGDLVHQIGGNEYKIVSGDKMELVKGNYSLIVNGDFKIKVTGNVLIDAGAGVHVNSPLICIDAESNLNLSGGNTISLTGEVMGDNIKAHTAAGIGDAPLPPFPCLITAENDADEEAIPDSTSPKEGFILDGPMGYLWKPTSDSSGKLITLSPEVASHQIYEALPTGELETVDIQYKHADNTITTWSVVRPVHRRGKLIETGKFKAIANGGRAHYTWSKAGEDYPSQVFWVIGGKTEWLIMQAGTRHD